MIASIADPNQVSAARRAAADFARASGFDETATAIVATEMATNLLKHASAGEIVIGGFADCDGAGLRAQDERPDVVLLDLKMPGMDGFEFLDRLAQIDAMRPVPAIMITSMRLGAEDRRRLGRATQIVAKSDLSADRLVSAIRHAIESRNASTTA